MYSSSKGFPWTLFPTEGCSSYPSKPVSWSTHLPWDDYTHNTLPSAATVMSPFMAADGFQPPLFLEQEAKVPSSWDHRQRCCRIWQAAHSVHSTAENLHLVDRHHLPAPAYVRVGGFGFLPRLSLSKQTLVCWHPGTLVLLKLLKWLTLRCTPQFMCHFSSWCLPVCWALWPSPLHCPGSSMGIQSTLLAFWMFIAGALVSSACWTGWIYSPWAHSTWPYCLCDIYSLLLWVIALS